MDIQQHTDRPELRQTILQGLSEAPVVALLGARQVGKTTLARQIASDWPGPSTILDLERPTVREALSRSPERMLSGREGLVVLDEIQRLPELFETLRPISDDPDRKAVFLLLGSASWDLIAGISETLAGRILFVDVAGFSVWEVGTAHLDRLWMRGGFPRAWLASSPEAWTRWMRSFTRTFLERDIPGLGSRVAPEALGRFWRMLAHWHGQLWNASELARSMDVSPTAVNHYRDLLAGSFMIRVLPPWFENLGKRLVKSPRVFLRDSGSCTSCWASKTRINSPSTHATAPVGRDSRSSKHSSPTAGTRPTSTGPSEGPNWTCCSCAAGSGSGSSSSAPMPRRPRSPCTSSSTTWGSNTCGSSIRASWSTRWPTGLRPCP